MRSRAYFAELPLAVQVQLAGIGPLLLGLVCGFVLGISGTAYWALSIAAGVAGLLGGLEHDDPRPAAARGSIAGTLFGVGVVVAHAGAPSASA